MTRRLLLDVSSLMYRAFFAMGDTVKTRDERPAGAVHGYLDWTARLARDRGHDEVIHCYDHEWRPVARTDMYDGYKAARPDEPPVLTAQFEMLRTVLDLAGFDQAQAPGWEAEDAIAALAAQATADDRIEMVSGDRDLIQLVRDPTTKLLYTVRGVSELHEFDEAAVQEKYGMAPQRYGDFAILRGDPSDGLPGVKGVGEKTALALVQAYGSLDEILEDAARDATKVPGPLKGKPALKARLTESAGYIETMRKLVPPNAGAELDRWTGERDEETLKALLDDLALKGPMQRLTAALQS
ncbi:MAG: 5'-3' exonuclease H3TH domain-containing protein [Actinomycetota bacterium]